jgi:hypothetical protein
VSTSVGAVTPYKISITPSQAIPSTSRIYVTFPNSVSLTDQTLCTILAATTGGILTSPGGCTVLNNMLTLTNAFGAGSFSTSAGSFSFTFSVGGRNPDAVYDSGAYTVKTTYFEPPNTEYTIDSSTFNSAIFTPTPKILLASVLPKN